MAWALIAAIICLFWLLTKKHKGRTLIPFGEWLPDLPAYGQHATVAKNCIPAKASYQPFPSLTVFSGALGAVCQGAIAVKSGVSSLNFAGTAAKLYLLSDATYADVSLAANYNGTVEDRWSWAMYGKRVIATNYTDYPQSYVAGTSTLFANLTTTLKARYVGVVREFVVLANTYDASDGAMANQVWWSAINDPTDFTPSVSTQSDKQQMYGEGDVGEITGFIGGEAGTIFMEGGVFRMTYVGGATIFSFDQIVFGAGCLLPGSIAAYGSMIYYLGPDGFYLLNGTSVMPIGKGKVDEWLYADMDPSLAHLCSSVIDPDRALYLLAYPGADNTGTCNRVIAYNWESGRWSYAEPGNIEALVNSITQALTPDSASAATIYGNPDTGAFANVSIDDRMFASDYLQKPVLAAINSDHKLSYFNATPLAAVVETAEAQIRPGRKSLINNVRPMIEGASTITVEAGTRDTTNEVVSYSDPATVNSYGEANLFASGRYHRARVTITGGFTHAYGLDFDSVQQGKY